MTYIPDYLKTYPNMNTSSPLHISLNRLYHGFRPHRHDFLEFSYVIDGRGSESINDAKHQMLPGTFTFVLPYQVHELFTEPGSTLVLYNCMFSMDLLMEPGQEEGLMDLIDQNTLPPSVQLSGADNERMKHLIEDMFREYAGQEPWRRTMLQVRLKEILAFLIVIAAILRRLLQPQGLLPNRVPRFGQSFIIFINIIKTSLRYLILQAAFH